MGSLLVFGFLIKEIHFQTKDVPLYYIGNYRIGEIYSCLVLV